jgi:hypothetical protein
VLTVQDSSGSAADRSLELTLDLRKILKKVSSVSRRGTAGGEGRLTAAKVMRPFSVTANFPNPSNNFPLVACMPP